MYIISNFQDYYDSMSYAYGVDKSITFKRDSESEINLDLRKLFSIELSRTVAHFIDSRSISSHSGNVVYSLLVTPNDIYRITETATKRNDFTTIQGVSHKSVIFTTTNEERTVSINPKIEKNIFTKQLVEELETNKKHIIETLYQYVDFPYFLLIPNHNYGFCKAVIPALYKLNFHDIMNAAECYQMVEMQVSRQGGNHDDKLITIANDDRIKQHGFDLKKSFRKR